METHFLNRGGILDLTRKGKLRYAAFGDSYVHKYQMSCLRSTQDSFRVPFPACSGSLAMGPCHSTPQRSLSGVIEIISHFQGPCNLMNTSFCLGEL